MEYKYKPNNKPSGLQAVWIRDRRAEGRKVWLVVGNKDGGRVYTNKNSKGTQYTKAEIVVLINSHTVGETIGKETKKDS